MDKKTRNLVSVSIYVIFCWFIIHIFIVVYYSLLCLNSILS